MKIFGKKKGWSDEEKLEKLTKFSLETMCDWLTEEIPQTGDFVPTTLYFDIPRTKHIAMIVVQYVDSPAQERSLWLRVREIGDEYCHSYFLKKGTNEELRDYLKEENSVEEWVGYIKELSDRVQEKDEYR